MHFLSGIKKTCPFHLSPALSLGIACFILFHALCRARYECLLLQGYWSEARFFRKCYIVFEFIMVLFILINMGDVLIYLDALRPGDLCLLP